LRLDGKKEDGKERERKEEEGEERNVTDQRPDSVSSDDIAGEREDFQHSLA